MPKANATYSPVSASCPELRAEQAAAFFALREALFTMFEAASRVMEPEPVETLLRAIRRWSHCHRAGDLISERTAELQKLLAASCGEFGGMVKLDGHAIHEASSLACKVYALMDRWL
jgi:hypothetical protein